MIVFDTTALIYAVGSSHPLRDPCLRLMELARERTLLATTTIEVIQEFAHIRARRYGRENAVRLALAYADALSPLLVAEESDLRDGMRIFADLPRIGSFDAVLAAATRSMDTVLVSADKAFTEVPNLAHVFPDEDGIRRLLS